MFKTNGPNIQSQSKGPKNKSQSKGPTSQFELDKYSSYQGKLSLQLQ